MEIRVHKSFLQVFNQDNFRFLKKSHRSKGQNEHCTLRFKCSVRFAPYFGETSIEFHISDMSIMNRHKIKMNQFMRYQNITVSHEEKYIAT